MSSGLQEFRLENVSSGLQEFGLKIVTGPFRCNIFNVHDIMLGFRFNSRISPVALRGGKPEILGNNTARVK